MNKTIALYAIAMFAIVLGLSSFAPEVIADSKKDKQNPHHDKNVIEFSKGASMVASSTTTVCHMPPGNPGNSHEIVVSTSSLTAHLKHGDNTGNCGN